MTRFGLFSENGSFDGVFLTRGAHDDSRNLPDDPRPSAFVDVLSVFSAFAASVCRIGARKIGKPGAVIGSVLYACWRMSLPRHSQ